MSPREFGSNLEQVRSHHTASAKPPLPGGGTAPAGPAWQAKLLHDRGVAFLEQGRPDQAAACFREALALQPDLQDTHFRLGIALQRLRQLNDAVLSFCRALECKPDDPAVLYHLAMTLKELGHADQAIACLRTIVALKPDSAEDYNNLGTVLREQEQLDEAVICFRKALALRPDLPEAYNNLGTTLQGLGHLDDAIRCFRKAVSLRPDLAAAHNNLGVAHRERGQLDQAIACFRTGLALKPDDPNAHLHLAMALLANGDMAAGWAEYEWRWQAPEQVRSRRGFAQPQWRGEPGGQRSLLIHAEQGFGDTLQFCRFVPLAASRGLRVVLEVQPPLQRLLRNLPGADAVVARGDALPAFDLHCPLLSLPLALGTTIATIPAAVSCLRADDAAVAGWRTRLAEMVGACLRVGLVWAGNPRSHQPSAAAVDRRRSMPVDRLAPLLDLPNVKFFSLQKDASAAPVACPIIDLMSGMRDFADTAALIANLDLVISVDTAVAHLAASLGKPVWLLDRSDPCWRWLRDRRDSPWYPTLRIYRQPQPRDWESVIAAVVHDLRGVIEHRGA